MTPLLAAAVHDPHAFRGLLDTVLCLAHPPEVLTRPAVQAALHHDHHHHEPPPAPGPDRVRLLQLLDADRPRVAA